jgi:hypothetical protein
VLAVGISLILLASVLHGWYGGNATASDADRARGFYSSGLKVLGASVLFLVCGFAATWYAAGFLTTVGSALLYFFALSPIVLYLLRSLGAVPREDKDWKERQRVQREYERITDEDRPPHRFPDTIRMRTVRGMEKCYFKNKYRYPGRNERAYLFMCLKSRYILKPRDSLFAIAWKCACLDDAIVEAIRLDSGDLAAATARCALETIPTCSKCGRYRAFGKDDGLCYGCREYGNLKLCYKCCMYWGEDKATCPRCGSLLAEVT